MNIGLLGYGGWGKIHAASIAALKTHRLTAIACRTEESADQARKDHPEASVTTDMDSVIRMPELDAIDIVLPTSLHVPAAVKALEAGKHVLLEKPMAGSLSECDRLIAAEKAAMRKGGGILSLVHEMRSSAQWSSIKDLVSDGKIGALRYAMLNLFRFPYRGGSGGWRYKPEAVGSWVLEEPIHFIDLLLWYFESHGNPVAVTAWAAFSAEGMTRDFSAVFEFPGGAYGVISQTLSGFEHHQVVEVAGESGAVRSLWSGAMDRTDKPVFSVTAQTKGETAPKNIPIEGPSGELFEIREYLNAAFNAMTEGRALYPADKERELVRLCLEAERSARLGLRIEL
ncbi:MAG: Gfo/Idh/MocA family oxidoreductase [Chrysiogenales bacterium]|nr:MAG: Gfo/Idh/MocA family oxidoreductase [Chrysiogenales bacterium]